MLPVGEIEDEFVGAVRAGEKRFVLEAPTGSGKSTLVPQFLLQALAPGEGEILVLQPRRMAARFLARTVARMRGGEPGGEIGYRVRFENATSRETRVCFVTEGVLVRDLVNDPEIREVAAVVFDEFHERHIWSDLSLALLKRLQETARPDLRLVVMSATLETERLQGFLEGARHFRTEGRTFPVEIDFYPPKQAERGRIWESAVRACQFAARQVEGPGHLLVFLPGQYEINKTLGLLERSSWAAKWELFPLHGSLPPARQDGAVLSDAANKIIVATNIAETSLTIEGVRWVIDSGLARVADFDPRRGIHTLTIDPISRASADQRAGRAGRTGPGFALRLWGPREHEGRRSHFPAEIHRLDLSETLLSLHALGVTDARNFPWFESPEPAMLERGERLLRDLDAVDSAGALTETGRAMARFPAHPRHSRLLVEGQRTGQVEAAARIVGALQGRNLFTQKANKLALPGEDSDFLLILRALEMAESGAFRRDVCARVGIHGQAAKEAWKAARQLARIAEREEGPEKRPKRSLARLLLAAFPDQVAVRLSEGTHACRLSEGRKGKLAEDTVVTGSGLLVAAEVSEVEGRELVVHLRWNTAISQEDLAQVFGPDSIREDHQVLWDPAQRRVINRQVWSFRGLELESRERGEPDQEEAAAILAERVLAGELVLKKWDRKVETWICRVNWLAEARPDWELPPLGQEDKAFLIREICSGARSYRELKEREVWPVLDSWLSPMQKQLLKEHAPERMALPRNRSAKIRYQEGKEPTAGATVQHLYDLQESPMIAGGSRPVVIEVWAPSQRPVQVTSDLRSFWANSYPAVRKELKGRYPKHEWR
ncbi:MAG: ATP-dependent helicase HrpB [Verrucomicrobiota bacterium]